MPAKEENKTKETENRGATTDHSIKALDLIDREKNQTGSSRAFTWFFIFYIGIIVYGVIQQTVWNFKYAKTDKDPTIIPEDTSLFIWAGLLVYNIMYLVKHNTGSLLAIADFVEKVGNILVKLKARIKLNKPNK